MNTVQKAHAVSLDHLSLQDAAQAVFDRWTANGCVLGQDDIFFIEDLRMALESRKSHNSDSVLIEPEEWAEWRKMFGIEKCSNCNGTGVDPNPKPVCCGNPENGECCGVPEPMWEQCRDCK